MWPLTLWPLTLWPLTLWPLALWPLTLWPLTLLASWPLLALFKPLTLWPLILWPLTLWPLALWPLTLSPLTLWPLALSHRPVQSSISSMKPDKCHDCISGLIKVLEVQLERVSSLKDLVPYAQRVVRVMGAAALRILQTSMRPEQTSSCSSHTLCRVRFPLLKCCRLLKQMALKQHSQIYVALKMCLTLLVSNCEGEGSFSVLKLVKHVLRTTMTQVRLSALSLLSIENEVVEGMDFENIVHKFAYLKSRRKATE
ncbi:hypothetical protein EYF80_057061 [Liparis tanakae]|uniref:HAT C-terminal dimerisation domain-containing protein n=1 Tax=Liparis tanakae TaxID=230148 RepID=A0A4Z2EV12_9TELE|nr:hypothetical protein EYF80_057061 [Liparis tanakae]